MSFSDAWIDGRPEARWRSASVLGASTGAKSSGCSLLEVPAGNTLARHTDSAEEIVVVTHGRARVHVGDEPPRELEAGEVALVPKDVPHHVESLGPEPLRFAAVYAAGEVVTTYDEPVQPDGERQRQSAS